MLLAAIALGVVLFVSVLQRDERGGSPGVDPGGPPLALDPTSPPAPGRAPDREPVLDAGTLGAEGRLQVGGDFPWKAAEKSYAGSGTLSGAVATPPGVAFPDRWTLVIEPSLFGKGREYAERRVREFDGVQRTFEERDLPLGGYRVHVEAEGMNGPAQEVLLFQVAERPELAGKNHAHLLLALVPAGHLDGSVRDERGVPLAGVSVHLLGPDGGTRLETESDHVGNWRIDGVRDGRYRLLFGHPERPLIEAEEVVFVGPAQRHPERVLPPLVELVVRVVDETGNPLPDATIRGFVRPRGAVEATTDEFGLARISDSLAGEYNVRVLHASGREGKSVFFVEADPPVREVEILCRPRR